MICKLRAFQSYELGRGEGYDWTTLNVAHFETASGAAMGDTLRILVDFAFRNGGVVLYDGVLIIFYLWCSVVVTFQYWVVVYDHIHITQKS